MALQKAVDTQRDFTAGELDATAKRRDDDEFVKKGMRQLSNARTLNTGAVQQRPGRNLLQYHSVAARDEDVLMAPGVKYRLSFTSAALTIFDSTGTQVFTEAGRAWTAATLGQIVWAVYLKQIFITFPGVVPEVLSWDGAVTWTSASFAELVLGGQKRTSFYRISPAGISMLPGAQSGAGVSCIFSAPVLVAGHVGTRIRFVGRQILITAVNSPTNATITIEETLPGTQAVNFLVDPSTTFAVGDLVEGSGSGTKGVVTGISSAAKTIQMQLMTTSQTAVAGLGPGQVGAFLPTDTIVGPGGSIAVNGISGIVAPTAVTIWDDEVMNSFRGWPASVFVDQGRLGFCDFPAVPGGIAWSSIGTPTDLYVGANPSDAMFEIVPGKAQVLYVMAGPESAEMVFCDTGVYYIPISPTNPLKPGSVQFLKISNDGAGTVQPRAVGNIIMYADGGLNQIHSIIATGLYYRPFEVSSLNELHSHLFNNIVTFALPTSTTQFPERYAYALNGDGTIAVGKYTLDPEGKLAGKIGWVPWTGAGSAKWISALNDVVLFVTAYTAGATTSYMLEQLDATLYLDASLPVNAIPAPLTPPGGKGPLWWLPTATVDLMDGLLPLGPHTTDANGFLIPLFPGEDLTSATLRAGFMWTGVWEPFVLTSQASQGADERMKKRRISRLQAYVMFSSGFRFAKFYSGQLGPNLPAEGAIVSDRRIPAYNQDDDATQPPPLREQSYAYKPLGRAHDPRAGIIKDTPGPLTLVEMAAKASI